MNRILVTLTLVVIAMLFTGCPNMAVPIESTDNPTKPVTDKPIAKVQVSKENIKEAEKLYNEGLKAIDTKDYRLALKELNQALKLNPNNAETLYKVGRVYTYKKQDKKAFNYYKKAIQVNPKYAPAYNNIGAIYQSRRNYFKAEEYLKKSISIDPYNAESHSGLAQIYSDQGNYEEALDVFNKALSLKYTSELNVAKTHFNIALLHYRKGDFVNAKIELHKGLNIDPSEKQAIKMLLELERKGY